MQNNVELFQEVTVDTNQDLGNVVQWWSTELTCVRSWVPSPAAKRRKMANNVYQE
jgi:hypothetical protein